jgi:hypothetical protein
VGGALALVAIWTPRIPQEQSIRLVLDPAGTATRRIVHVEIVGAADREPRLGATLSVPAGRNEVSHTSRLPAGEYVLDVRVGLDEAPGDPAHTDHDFRVELRGEPTTVYLYDWK